MALLLTPLTRPATCAWPHPFRTPIAVAHGHMPDFSGPLCNDCIQAIHEGPDV